MHKSTVTIATAIKKAKESQSSADVSLILAEEQKPAILANGLNLDDVKASLNDIQWNAKDLSIWLKSQFKVDGKSVTEMLGKLAREQAEIFLKEIEERGKLR